MASNPYVNKVQLADGTTVIDISDSTAVASDVAQGKYFYTAAGEKVQGTASGGGSSKNVQILSHVNRKANNTTMSAVNAMSMTVAKTGTYDVYWVAFRSSATDTVSATQLYIDGEAYGTAQNSYTNHAQAVHLSGVSLTKDQTVALYAKTRSGSSYYTYVGDLVIIEA